MVIVVRYSYPLASTGDAVKVFTGMPPVPDFLTQKGPYITSEEGVGISGIVLYEFENSKLKEALDEVAKRMISYYSVPGYTYDLRPYYGVDEALKLLG